MKDKTGRAAFNRAAHKPMGHKPKAQRQYSHRQLLSALDRYKALAKTRQHKDEMDKIRSSYLKDRDTKDATELARRRNFMKGINHGLHWEVTRQDMMDQRTAADRRARARAMDRAKTYYRQNYSVTRAFSAARKTKTRIKAKGKDRDMTKDKG